MNFQCKNCGSVMVYEPKGKVMYCAACGSTNSETRNDSDVLTVCSACGGSIDPHKYDLTSECPYCGNFLIYNSRVSNEYLPNKMIPFKVNKHHAIERLEKELGKLKYAPSSFLKEKTLVDFKGYYVPFFMYDCDAKGRYTATGKVIRSWSSGNYDYTETSTYAIDRDINASFENLPADASYAMDDKIMDIMEPFDYRELTDFDPKYLSGFFGEIYNEPAEFYMDRVKSKVGQSVKGIMKESLKGYTTISNESFTCTQNYGETEYALFPVWIYKYHYMGKDYEYYVNGQTGKVHGAAPVSIPKILLYSATSGIVVMVIMDLMLTLLKLFTGV